VFGWLQNQYAWASAVEECQNNQSVSLHDNSNWSLILLLLIPISKGILSCTVPCGDKRVKGTFSNIVSKCFLDGEKSSGASAVEEQQQQTIHDVLTWSHKLISLSFVFDSNKQVTTTRVYGPVWKEQEVWYVVWLQGKYIFCSKMCLFFLLLVLFLTQFLKSYFCTFRW
jgi:hypothetical protein